MAHLMSKEDRHDGSAVERSLGIKGGEDREHEEHDVQPGAPHLYPQEPCLKIRPVVSRTFLYPVVEVGKHVEEGYKRRFRESTAGLAQIVCVEGLLIGPVVSLIDRGL